MNPASDFAASTSGPVAARRRAPNVPVSSSSAVWIGTTIIATKATSRTIISRTVTDRASRIS
jgi:hypothetical protein